MSEMHERMAKVETEVKNLKTNNSKEHKDMMDKMDRFIDSADNKYAPRWILTLLSWLAGIVAAGISGGVIRYLW